MYKAEPELYYWFEFLNQGDLDEDLLIGDVKKTLFSKKKEEEKSPEIRSLDNMNNQSLNKNLEEIEKEIAKCLLLLKQGFFLDFPIFALI